jgi:hypothetical protein
MKWIPTPIYKSLPFAYILIGIVCFFQKTSSLSKMFYMFSGAIFIFTGLLVIGWRWTNRSLLPALEEKDQNLTEPVNMTSHTNQ